MLTRWKRQIDPSCPIFHREIEDATHVWRCQHPSVLEIWTKQWSSMDKWMREYGTEDSARLAIILGLKNWYRGYTCNWRSQRDLSKECRLAAMEQESMGWKNMLEGILCEDWMVIQDKHFWSKGSRKTGDRWAIRLVKHIWDALYVIWTFRNSVVHSNRGSTSVKSNEINLSIQRQMDIGVEDLAPKDHDFLQVEPQSLLSSSFQNRTLWLETVSK